MKYEAPYIMVERDFAENQITYNFRIDELLRGRKTLNRNLLLHH
jgi:hypothetical protein